MCVEFGRVYGVLIVPNGKFPCNGLKLHKLVKGGKSS